MIPASAQVIDSPAAWRRLAVALLIGSIGSVGMWSFVVALPAVQADFGLARGAASLPYTLTMVGFGFGGVAMGRLSDRSGVFVPLVIGALTLGAGYVAAALAPSFGLYAGAHLLVGFRRLGEFSRR